MTGPFEKPPSDPKRILPAGTQVVALADVSGPGGEPACPKGAVGIIVLSPPDHKSPYIVRFLDGGEAAVGRKDLAVRRQFERGPLGRGGPGPGVDLKRFVIYRCVVGSRAYGLETDASDVDRRGVYLPPAELHWSLWGLPEQLEDQASQECYWEIQKFVTLALKANPNVLECLYTPIVEHATPLARELLEKRSIFLSQLAYQTYNGYVMSQFRKIEADIRTKGKPKWKHAMHLIRLLLSGVAVLEEGRVPVRVDEHRERLLAVRDGKMHWADVNRWRLELHKEFEAAYRWTRLPEQPDYEAADRFLVKARRSMA